MHSNLERQRPFKGHKSHEDWILVEPCYKTKTMKVTIVHRRLVASVSYEHYVSEGQNGDASAIQF